MPTPPHPTALRADVEPDIEPDIEPDVEPEPVRASAPDPSAVLDAAREWLAGSVRLPQVTAARAQVELVDVVDPVLVVSDAEAFEGRRAPRRRWGRGDTTRVTRERTLRAPGGEAIGLLVVDLVTVGGGEEQLLADVLTDSLTSAIWMRLVDGDERRHGRALREVVQEGTLAATTRDALLDESLVATGLVSLELGSLGRVTRANHRLQRLTGRTAEELVGASYLDLLEPAQRVQQEAGLRRAAAGRRMPFRSEGLLRGSGGAGHGGTAAPTVRVVTTPVLDAEDRPVLATVQVEVVEPALESLAHRWEAEREETGGLLSEAGFAEVTAEALDRARRTGEGAAMYCARIEDWDRLVLRLGPEGAADVRRFVADQLRGALRSDDVLGHVRPDELAFVAEEIDPDQADLLARRLATALRAPYEVGGRRVDLALSLGVAMVGPSGTGPESLARARRSADRAGAPVAGAPAAQVRVGPTAPADGREPTFFPHRRRRRP